MVWILMLLLRWLRLQLLGILKRDFPLTANAWATLPIIIDSNRNETIHTLIQRYGLSWFYYNLLEICFTFKTASKCIEEEKKAHEIRVATASLAHFIAHMCLLCTKSPFQGNTNEIYYRNWNYMKILYTAVRMVLSCHNGGKLI